MSDQLRVHLLQSALYPRGARAFLIDDLGIQMPVVLDRYGLRGQAPFEALTLRSAQILQRQQGR